MPEGPEIKQAADRIAKAIVNQPLTEVFFAFDSLKSYEKILATEQVIAVRSYGKALLTRFSNQLSIYSHNQLYGVWYVRTAYSYPTTNRQLRLAIHTAKKSALLYSASDILVLNDVEIAAHPFLAKLGLDVLADDVTVAQVRDRFTDKRFLRRSFPTLLLDQHFLCGIGNYLRSEILFFARVHPAKRPIDCSPEQLDQLAIGAITLARQSYETQGITNDLAIALPLKQAGYPRRSYRHFVFGRSSQPCYRCSTSIVKEMAGGRRVYYCPTCQPP
jgi:endonuclease VIII